MFSVFLVQNQKRTVRNDLLIIIATDPRFIRHLEGARLKKFVINGEENDTKGCIITAVASHPFRRF